MEKISAIITTKNEEKNIERCLNSVKWADEIVVVDNFSEDRTVELCRKFTDKIYQVDFVDYSCNKNYALKKASNEWVFLLDADEEAIASLRNEINEFKNDSDACYVPIISFFGEKPFTLTRQIRLFKKSKAQFKGEVHETISLNGKVSALTSPIHNFSYNSLGEMIEKNKKYAEIESHKLKEKNLFLLVSLMFAAPFHQLIHKAWETVEYRKILFGLNGILWNFFLSFMQFYKYFKAVEFKLMGIENISCGFCGSNECKNLYSVGSYRFKGKLLGPFKIVKCSKCGLIQTFPRLKEGETKKIYDSLDYNEYPKRIEEFRLYANSGLEFIEGYLPKGFLLDYGCGIGVLVKTANDRGWAAEGYDPAKTLIDFGKKKFNAKLFSSKEELNKKYDVIMLNHVLEHSVDPIKLLGECKKLMKKNSVLVVGVPNFNSIYRIIKGKNWYLFSPHEHLYHFTCSSLEKTLKMAGLTAEKKFFTLYDFEARTKKLSLPKRIARKFLVSFGMGEGMLLFCRKSD